MTVVALVGRPNVGKSTLFNRLTSARDALVANRPGLTRDRQYGVADLDGRTVSVIDTGGLANDVDDAEMASLVAEQANVAIAESDWVVFLVNAREGLTASDEEIADDLRRCGARTLLVANKIDGVPPETAVADFSRLGFGVPLLMSAAHGRGIAAFRERLAECASTGAKDTMAQRTAMAQRMAQRTAMARTVQRTPMVRVQGVVRAQRTATRIRRTPTRVAQGIPIAAQRTAIVAQGMAQGTPTRA